MTDTQPALPQPKYRKQLNPEQLDVLQQLYSFRFSTGEQIARYSQKKTSKSIQNRLLILEQQGFIAKRYDKTYKLKGKPAAYYLLPKGARTLAQLTGREGDEPINVKGIYKDKVVSESFIAHSLSTLHIYLQLSALYGSRVEFFTRSEMNYDHYDYYPRPLPDAYIRLETSEGQKEFFLDIFGHRQPFFVRIRRIKKYLAYAESGEWNGELPVILMVCEDKSTHKRLRKRIASELRSAYEDITFATSNIQYLLDANNNGKVWLPIDDCGDDKNEPRKPVALSSIS